MAHRVNVKYCPNCGGVTQWEEVDPTVTATIMGRVVKPKKNQFLMDWPANTVTAAGMTTSERTCQCSAAYVDIIY